MEQLAVITYIRLMGSTVATSILYVEKTNDQYLKSRLIDTVRWTLTVYLHHNGEYGWGQKRLGQ